MHKQKILFKHLENGAEKWYNDNEKFSFDKIKVLD